MILVSKDLPLRVKAAAMGLTAQEYRAELPPDSGWTGMRELDVTAAEIDELYENGQHRPASCPGPALPHRPGADLRRAGSRQRARPGAAG